MDARKDFINSNMGLVHICAKKFSFKGVEYDDLVQAGCVGLIKAVDGFDAEKGVQFSTYAIPCILGEIKKIFRDGGIIKVSRSLKDLSLKIKHFSDAFSKKEGREPTLAEISSNLNVEPEMIAQAINAGLMPKSLTCSDDNDSELEILVESHDEKISEKIAVKQIISTLEDRDQKIVTLRFFKNNTQSQTAKILGMSQVQVSRREKKILEIIREKLIS